MFTNHIQQPFIVIGMHRSGTTMLAEAMNRAGIFMGVMRDHNSEAFHFLSLNQQMLQAAGGDWLSPKVVTAAFDLTIPPLAIYAEHIKSDSVNPAKLKLLYNFPWGWKDPRNTFTLERWLQRFPAAKVIHVVRDGRAVVRSLQNRNVVKGEVQDDRLENTRFCLDLWEQYVREGHSWSEKLGEQFLEIRFEDLATANEKVVEDLDEFTGKPISRFLENRSKSSPSYSSELNELAARSDLFQELGYTV